MLTVVSCNGDQEKPATESLSSMWPWPLGDLDIPAWSWRTAGHISCWLTRGKPATEFLTSIWYWPLDDLSLYVTLTYLRNGGGLLAVVSDDSDQREAGLQGISVHQLLEGYSTRKWRILQSQVWEQIVLICRAVRPGWNITILYFVIFFFHANFRKSNIISYKFSLLYYFFKYIKFGTFKFLTFNFQCYYFFLFRWRNYKIQNSGISV